MKKLNAYQLYLSGVISENQYHETSEQENIIRKFILEINQTAMKYCGSNKKVLTKVEIYIKRIELNLSYLQMFGGVQQLVQQIQFVLEDIADIVIPQIEHYLATGADDDDMLKFYPDFGKEDFELHLKTLNMILSKAYLALTPLVGS